MLQHPSLLPRAAWSACAALVAVVAMLGLWSAALAPDSGQPSGTQQVDISRDWRFRLDPDNVGLREGWAAPGYNDRGWALIDAGRPWDDQGFPQLNGYAWYRRSVVVPAGWRGLPLYLWLSGIDDEGDVFVNGNLVAHFGDRATNSSGNNNQDRVDLGELSRKGGTLAIAVRVNNWGGVGGLTGLPAAIATSGVALFSDERYVKYLFDRNPDLPWPYWLRLNQGLPKPRGASWAMFGTEGSSAKSLVGLDSSIMANQEGVTLTPWVYDRAAGQLYVPAPPDEGGNAVSFKLQDGYLPAPEARWTAAGLAISSTLFVASTFSNTVAGGPVAAASADRGEGDVTFYALAVENEGSAPRDLSLYLALRPYNVAGRLSKVYSLARAGSAVLVNGGTGLLADQPPDGFGAAPSLGGDVALFARDGNLPPDEEARDSRGLASGALHYHLLLQPGETRTLSFKLPANPQADAGWPDRLRRLDFAQEQSAVLAGWRDRLGAIDLALPDTRYVEAYYASQANLYTARNGDLLLPGPLTHRHFWYRDAAYLSLALLRSGRSEVVKPLLSKLVAGQLPSGEFPAILEPDGKPALPLKHEWDAQGEGIFTLTSYYRWTKDATLLGDVYPTIRRAALFLVALRTSGLRPELRSTPAYGILPPSDSAEDLGPAEWRHYWDDFWAITGLREAAFAANALGEHEDAQRFEDEAAQLRLALLDSIRMVQRTKGIDYVPNGPDDTDTSAMARGTSPALWPEASFDPSDPLLRRSFEVYFQRWLQPNGGAYRHQGDHFWPYGGLELAHAYLLLGMTDEVQTILDWTLANQTFPGLYAWAESVLPASNRFADGDMPHAWAAAEYVLLLRDMLIREDGDRLVIGSYLPHAWLADGQHVGVAGLPTLFGPTGFSIESHAAAGYWELSLRAGADPPAGYLWHLPQDMAVNRVEVDGRDWREYDASGVRVPADAHLVRVFGALGE